MDRTRCSKSKLRAAVLSLFTAGAVLGAALGAHAQDWQGRVEERRGVFHVSNPPEPYSPPVLMETERLWQAGGDEDDKVLFGAIVDLATDKSGQVYALDSRLNQVVIFSPEGRYLRAIGSGGKGPGEFELPGGIFLTPEGNVAVVQKMPGRISVLTPQGEPLGDLALPEPGEGAMLMLADGAWAGKHAIVSLSEFSRRETAFSTSSSLIAVDDSGETAAKFHETRERRDFAGMVFDERKIGSGALAWAVDEEGRVYTSTDFDKYRVHVWDAGGSLTRVIEVDYPHRRRPPEASRQAAPLAGNGSRGRNQTPEVKASEIDRDIQQIFPRSGAEIWVLSSRGAFDAPAGIVAVFDVIDSEGRFVRRATVEGKGNWARDGFHIAGDRFYVAAGLRSGQRAIFNPPDASAPADSVTMDESISLTCYRLGPAR